MVLQFGMMGAPQLGGALVSAILGIALGAVILWLTGRIFKLKNKSFTTPLIISAIAGAVGFVMGFIPVLNMLTALVVIVLTVWLIKTRYKVDWLKAILVGLVYFVLSLIMIGIIGLLFFGGMMAMMGGMAG